KRLECSLIMYVIVSLFYAQTSTNLLVVCFFFNATATTEIYTLSLHDALPISVIATRRPSVGYRNAFAVLGGPEGRSEEHTSELQSRQYLVCRLLLEKKKN